jgi:hypothetical protein
VVRSDIVRYLEKSKENKNKKIDLFLLYRMDVYEIKKKTGEFLPTTSFTTSLENRQSQRYDKMVGGRKMATGNQPSLPDELFPEDDDS